MATARASGENMRPRVSISIMIWPRQAPRTSAKRRCRIGTSELISTLKSLPPCTEWAYSTDNENTTMTTTSIKIATVSTTVENGPFASSSRITAMAEAGERATMTVADITEALICAPSLKCFRKSTCSAMTNMAIKHAVHVKQSTPAPRMLTVLRFVLTSDHISWLPAAMEIAARHKSSANHSWSAASLDNTPNPCGPHNTPVTR
mmetsp:Transcript_26058/g.49498  ORF Transcript_26058/g.49498 Transcript_26058/m.49498 type:complete len:205 (+) Transcript_26058:1075-1689(+)